MENLFKNYRVEHKMKWKSVVHVQSKVYAHAIHNRDAIYKL